MANSLGQAFTKTGGPVTLALLWDGAEAVKGNENFVTLRINSESRPVTLMDGDGWLAFIQKNDDGRWSVGVWRGQFENVRLFDEKDQAAIAAIKAELKLSGTEKWRTVVRASSPQPFQPSP